jgi:hypothetical protein
MMPGEATQIEPHGVELGFAGLTSRGGTGHLIATRLTALLRCAGGRAVVDEVMTLALGTYPHRHPPPRTRAYRSEGGSITGCEI